MLWKAANRSKWPLISDVRAWRMAFFIIETVIELFEAMACASFSVSSLLAKKEV
jgi:hypothetical protein